ncbi:MAG: 1-acyl-sn-glycerol-3-phosphate acyltransferase [Trueperaceae bacterium]
MDPRAAFLRKGFDLIVRRRLRGVWLRGEIPTEGFVWASNHHGWYDAFVAATLLWRKGRDVTVVVSEENLASHGYLRRAGAIGTREVRRAVRALEHGGVVVIFPEGELRPAGPLGPLAEGAAWLAQQARAPLMAVATRVALRGHEFPEAYLDLSRVESGALEPHLRERLAALDDALRSADPRAPLPGFALAMGGTRSWEERLTGLRGRGREAAPPDGAS